MQGTAPIARCKSRLWRCVELDTATTFSRSAKVQKLPASFSSSELSAHQMAPSGVIAHWRSYRALEPTFHLSSFVSPLLPLGLGFLLPRGYFQRLSCCCAGLLCTPYGFAWFCSETPYVRGSREMAMARASLGVPSWPDCTFTAVVQINGSRGLHHSSSLEGRRRDTCSGVFKPEWAQS